MTEGIWVWGLGFGVWVLGVLRHGLVAEGIGAEGLDLGFRV